MIAALLLAGALLVGGLVGIVASSGLVVVPVFSNVLFKSLPEPGEGYAVPRDAADERRDRISEIGDELRDFFQYGIKPATGAFELSERDVADMLAELVVGLEGNTVLRSVAVDLAPNSVNAFLVVDVAAAAGGMGVSSLMEGWPLEFGVTTVELRTSITFVDRELNVDIEHVQVGHAPGFVGSILAIFIDNAVDNSVARLPVDEAIERLTTGAGKVILRFKDIVQ